LLILSPSYKLVVSPMLNYFDICQTQGLGFMETGVDCPVNAFREFLSRFYLGIW